MENLRDPFWTRGRCNLQHHCFHLQISGKGGINPVHEMAGQFQFNKIIGAMHHPGSNPLLGIEIAFQRKNIHGFSDGYCAYRELLLDVPSWRDQVSGTVFLPQDAAFQGFGKLDVDGGFVVGTHGLNIQEHRF